MDQNLPQEKWQATFRAALERAEADQIWPFFQDFFGVHKWFSGVPNCQGIHGANGEPGCIRYSSGFGRKRAEENNDSGLNNVSWSKERLVVMDHAQRTFTYEIVDSNIGFKSYTSTIKVVPGGGCAVEWSISLDPVEGLKLEDLVINYKSGLELMLKKMELAIFGSS